MTSLCPLRWPTVLCLLPGISSGSVPQAPPCCCTPLERERRREIVAGMTHPTRSLSAQSPPGAPEQEAALEQPKELSLCQALDWARHHLVKRWSCQLETRDLAAAPDQWALSVSAHLAMPGRSLKEQDGLSDAHPEGGSPLAPGSAVWTPLPHGEPLWGPSGGSCKSGGKAWERAGPSCPTAYLGNGAHLGKAEGSAHQEHCHLALLPQGLPCPGDWSLAFTAKFPAVSLSPAQLPVCLSALGHAAQPLACGVAPGPGRQPGAASCSPTCSVSHSAASQHLCALLSPFSHFQTNPHETCCVYTKNSIDKCYPLK